MKNKKIVPQENSLMETAYELASALRHDGEKAASERDYWKQRCEAAEAYMSLMRNNYCYEQDEARIKWQSLKQKQL